jgi:hypothetical protein
MVNSAQTRRAIYRAEDGDGVLHAVRGFVDSLEERHLRLLPIVAEAPRPYTNETISRLALALARQELYASAYDERLPLLREVASVFAAASMQLAAIEHGLSMRRAAAGVRNPLHGILRH